MTWNVGLGWPESLLVEAAIGAGLTRRRSGRERTIELTSRRRAGQ